MTSHNLAFPLRTSDTAPVTEWLDDLRQRFDGWAATVKNVSSDEWQRLQGAVAGAMSMDRVQGVLRDFLHRMGVAGVNEIASDYAAELKIRVLEYRRGESIEQYQDHLFPPPRIQV